MDTKETIESRVSVIPLLAAEKSTVNSGISFLEREETIYYTLGHYFDDNPVILGSFVQVMEGLVSGRWPSYYGHLIGPYIADDERLWMPVQQARSTGLRNAYVNILRDLRRDGFTSVYNKGMDFLLSYGELYGFTVESLDEAAIEGFTARLGRLEEKLSETRPERTSRLKFDILELSERIDEIMQQGDVEPVIKYVGGHLNVA